DAGAAAARLEVKVGELESQFATLGNEIAQTRTEPIPPLSDERERALAALRTVDREAAPLYRHLDLGREALPWADAIEGLLEHLDVLTLLVPTVQPEQLRGALGGQVDWHVLLPNPATGKAARGSVASMLVTTHADVRRYLDGAFGGVALASEPARSGDYLCPD